MSLPLWTYWLLGNAVVVLAFVVTVGDELQVPDDWPRWFRWLVRGLLVAVALTVGAALIAWIGVAEWHIARRARQATRKRRGRAP